MTTDNIEIEFQEMQQLFSDVLKKDPYFSIHLCEVANDHIQLDGTLNSSHAIAAEIANLQQILPSYLQLLSDDIAKYGQETYRDRKEFSLIRKQFQITKQIKPKIQFDDPKHGTSLAYSLLQVAAAQHGINDEHVVFWYRWLSILLRIDPWFQESPTIH